MSHATGAVVDFVHRADLAEFPAEALATAKRCIIDGLGVLLAGSVQPASAIAAAYVREAAARSLALAPS